MCSKQIGACLTNIDQKQSGLGLTSQTVNGIVSSTSGKARGLVKLIGSQHGETGYVRLSSGKELVVPIRLGRTGQPLMPQLKGPGLRLVDDELRTEGHINPINHRVTAEFETTYAPALVQLKAATATSPFDAVVTRLTRLKLQKPTQAMDETMTAVFLEDLAEMLEQDGFCYAAIDEGITKLIKNEKEKFFPTYERLRHYIYPIHYQHKRRADKLEQMLERRHSDVRDGE